MGGGNRLQIRDQQLRYTPGADFEWIWRKLKFVKTKGGPLGNLFKFQGKNWEFPKGPPLVFTNFNFLQIHSKSAPGVYRSCWSRIWSRFPPPIAGSTVIPPVAQRRNWSKTFWLLAISKWSNGKITPQVCLKHVRLNAIGPALMRSYIPIQPFPKISTF